jgi:hypothetical protein
MLVWLISAVPIRGGIERRRRRPAGECFLFCAQLMNFLIVFPAFGRNFCVVRAELGVLGRFGTAFSGGWQFQNANLDA